MWRAVIDELKKMPYYKNYAAASGLVHNVANHEEAVEKIFSKHGMVKWIPTKKLTKKTVELWLTTPTSAVDMPTNSFVAQPCGTHEHPDFLWKLNDSTLLAVECKSSTDSCHPQYNSGGIKANTLYIYSCQKVNQTTLYFGKDIITGEAQAKIDELIAKQRELEREFNEALRAVDLYNRGISYYTRPMIIQSGGATATNYFTHVDRLRCERNVYSYIEWMLDPEEQPIATVTDSESATLTP